MASYWVQRHGYTLKAAGKHNLDGCAGSSFVLFRQLLSYWKHIFRQSLIFLIDLLRGPPDHRDPQDWDKT